jgi:chromate transporter
MNTLKKLIQICWTFLLISPVTFGGGYAMIPAMEREIVGKRQWLSEEEMSEMFSIAGAAPGGIGVNASALIGYRLAGTAGAIAAVIGITLPTFFIAILLSVLYTSLQNNAKMQAMLEGVQAAIVGLIIVAAYKMAKASVVDKITLWTAICTVVVLMFVPIHPLIVILCGLFIGVVIIFFKIKMGMPNPIDKEASAEASKRYLYADYFIADGI